ncbi:MAG: hypothetical protein AAFY15_02050, partial [Cyanobacteria bacterium J06648_11]
MIDIDVDRQNTWRLLLSFGIRVVLENRVWFGVRAVVASWGIWHIRRWALALVWCVTCWVMTSASLTAIAKAFPPKLVELQAQVETTQDLID